MIRMRIIGVLNWTLCGVSVALGAAGLVLMAQAFPSLRDMFLSTQSTGNGVAALTVSIVGALIVMFRPRNRVGWIFCAAGFFNAVETFADAFAHYGMLQSSQPAPVVSWMNWLQSWIWVPAFGPLITLLPLLFPDGQLLSPRWRIVAWLSVLWMLCTSTAIALTPTPTDSGIINPDNPSVLPGAKGVLPILSGIGVVLMFATWMASVVSLIMRYRRSPARERLQIKWLTYAAAVFLVIYPFVFFLHVTSEDVRLVLTGVALIAFGGLPVSVGIAILRHRLYDIDLIVRRTLVYGALSASLVVVYWAGVVILQQLLKPFTQGSDLAIVASTLGVAALFQPARRRIQQVVDRRFYRQSYDAARTLESFSSRLRDDIDLTNLRSELLGAVGRTMQPAHASLWLRRAE